MLCFVVPWLMLLLNFIRRNKIPCLLPNIHQYKLLLKYHKWIFGYCEVGRKFRYLLCFAMQRKTLAMVGLLKINVNKYWHVISWIIMNKKVLTMNIVHKWMYNSPPLISIIYILWNFFKFNKNISLLLASLKPFFTIIFSWQLHHNVVFTCK